MPRPLSFVAALAAVLFFPPPGARALPRVDQGPSCLVYPDYGSTLFGIHRGTPKLLDALLGGRVRFDDPAGVACAHMLDCGDDGSKLTVFGLNRGAGQIVYNPDGMSLETFGSAGAGEGRFWLPQGIACLPDGTVAVADTGNDRVVFLRFSGGRLRWGHVLGRRGAGPGRFLGPEGVALDSQGHLYVADTGNNRVEVFDRRGRFLEAFGGDAQADNAVVRPRAIAVVDALEPYARHPESAVFVIDLGGERLQKFGLDGQFLGQAVASDLGRSAVRFDSLALDYYDNVWVTDRLNDQIHKFDEHLQWIADWGHAGEGDGALNDPRGIAINRPYGQVIEVERDSAQYLWVGADVEDLRFSHRQDPGRGGSMRIDYRLSERAWVDAWVEDLGGRRLAGLLDHGFQEQGAQTLFWDGGMDQGGIAKAGTYALVLQAEAAYSSATFVKRELRRNFVLMK
jgi:DNA-binding beta-propeller fold protein YncE